MYCIMGLRKLRHRVEHSEIYKILDQEVAENCAWVIWEDLQERFKDDR